jgi:hypothetical protein
MSSTSRSHLVAFSILATLLFAASAHAQRIHRWVDDKGQVHYTDHPPPEAMSRAEVVADIPKSPYVPPRVAVVAEAAGSANDKSDPKSRAETPQQEQQDAYRKRKKQEELEQAQRDKAVVDKCKQRRDIYCGQGAATILQKENDKAWDQYHAAQRNREGLPPGTAGPPLRQPPTLPPTSSSRKK